MDRQEAAVHYVSQAELALANTLEWCKETYGDIAVGQLSRMFTEAVFGENLLSYCEVEEVLSLWGIISRWNISERTYGGEFIVALNQQFNMYVEPAVIASAQDAKNLTNLTALGAHLVSTIARNHPLAVMEHVLVHEELSSYLSFLKDVPKPEEVTILLSYFPWIAPLWLLSFSNPLTLTTLLKSYVVNPGAVKPLAGSQ